MKAGTRWRIWSGEKVRVLDDAWLNDIAHPFVVSQHPTLVNKCVAALMKLGEKFWDREVIIDLFDERDQHLIPGIPLSRRQEEDIRYWYKDDKGLYTVESAYKLVQDMKGEWVANANSGFWRRLWNLKIPPTVNNFLWRACNG